MDSPGSPLSELSSEDFQEEEHDHAHASIHAHSDQEHDAESSRPNKRQRVAGPGGPHNWDNLPAPPPEEDISSDTDGSVPGSPHMGAAGGGDDEDYGGYGHREQISACKWDGCEAGDLGNMDLLVQHLHDEHIHARQKKYSCEWGDCTRKGIPHASGYALRAHMRSHTREKPFYCSLPECDRSFTRSDALAKHMRTVHETEALRPSDPVPKHHSSNPQNKSQRIRLTFKGTGGASVNGTADLTTKVEAPKSIKSNTSAPASPSTVPTIPPPDLDYEHSNVLYLPAPMGSSHDAFKQFPPDIHFTEWESSLRADELFQVLKIQLQELNMETEELRKELQHLDVRKKQEWLAKELVMENTMESDLAIEERRSRPDAVNEDAIVLGMMKADIQPALSLNIEGERTPWWREHGVKSIKNLQLAEQEAVGAMVKMEQGGDVRVVGDELMGSL